MYVKALKYSPPPHPPTNGIRNSISSGLLHVTEGGVLQKKKKSGCGDEERSDERKIDQYLIFSVGEMLGR